MCQFLHPDYPGEKIRIMLQICIRSAPDLHRFTTPDLRRSGADLEQNLQICSRSGPDLEFCSRSAPDLRRSGVENLHRSGADLEHDSYFFTWVNQRANQNPFFSKVY